MPAKLHVLVPFWGMAGGVIKILDYAHHAALGGVRTVHLWAPTLPGIDDAVWSLPVFNALNEGANVNVRPLDQLTLRDEAEPLVLFTEPTHHPLIERAATHSLGPRLIHLIQGTRHANPAWSNGRNYRLLHRPMTRIAVTEQVADALAPHVNTRFTTQTILEGHDGAYFAAGARQRASSRSVFRVLYTTWKSDLGDRVATALADDPLFTFEAIRQECGWPELRRHYHRADMFVCTPGPEEGFYLPGIEAMAAGCAVVSSFVGGNESYLDDGHNVVRAPYGDVHAHVEALRSLAQDANLRGALVDGGHETVAAHLLEREREEFLNLLSTLAG